VLLLHDKLELDGVARDLTQALGKCWSQDYTFWSM
jgi:hypothetical protein